ncbi:hypothetical protein, conserved [Plasmodium gonderi]|uniref:Transporter n=1 Tax=Plasmodium gonderi TaxID=77519 RepID=A0A1Y1JJU4_PLAGO|nr:hypothetical protein, conserved [Plasmodium gonderi]GAW82769.1 hypothetical protein, conserved [Plasmodium gonderi]
MRNVTRNTYVEPNLSHVKLRDEEYKAITKIKILLFCFISLFIYSWCISIIYVYPLKVSDTYFTLHFTLQGVGSLILGLLSDIFGRKKCLNVSFISLILISTLTFFSLNPCLFPFEHKCKNEITNLRKAYDGDDVNFMNHVTESHYSKGSSVYGTLCQHFKSAELSYFAYPVETVHQVRNKKEERTNPQYPKMDKGEKIYHHSKLHNCNYYEQLENVNINKGKNKNSRKINKVNKIINLGKFKLRNHYYANYDSFENFYTEHKCEAHQSKITYKLHYSKKYITNNCSSNKANYFDALFYQRNGRINCVNSPLHGDSTKTNHIDVNMDNTNDPQEFHNFCNNQIKKWPIGLSNLDREELHNHLLTTISRKSSIKRKKNFKNLETFHKIWKCILDNLNDTSFPEEKLSPNISNKNENTTIWKKKKKKIYINQSNTLRGINRKGAYSLNNPFCRIGEISTCKFMYIPEINEVEMLTHSIGRHNFTEEMEDREKWSSNKSETYGDSRTWSQHLLPFYILSCLCGFFAKGISNILCIIIMENVKPIDKTKAVFLIIWVEEIPIFLTRLILWLKEFTNMYILYKMNILCYILLSLLIILVLNLHLDCHLHVDMWKMQRSNVQKLCDEYEDDFAQHSAHALDHHEEKKRTQNGCKGADSGEQIMCSSGNDSLNGSHNGNFNLSRNGRVNGDLFAVTKFRKTGQEYKEWEKMPLHQGKEHSDFVHNDTHENSTHDNFQTKKNLSFDGNYLLIKYVNLRKKKKVDDTPENVWDIFRKNYNSLNCHSSVERKAKLKEVKVNYTDLFTKNILKKDYNKIFPTRKLCRNKEFLHYCKNLKKRKKWELYKMWIWYHMNAHKCILVALSVLYFLFHFLYINFFLTGNIFISNIKNESTFYEFNKSTILLNLFILLFSFFLYCQLNKIFIKMLNLFFHLIIIFMSFAFLLFIYSTSEDEIRLFDNTYIFYTLIFNSFLFIQKASLFCFSINCVYTVCKAFLLGLFIFSGHLGFITYTIIRFFVSPECITPFNLICSCIVCILSSILIVLFIPHISTNVDYHLIDDAYFNHFLFYMCNKKTISPHFSTVFTSHP